MAANINLGKMRILGRFSGILNIRVKKRGRALCVAVSFWGPLSPAQLFFFGGAHPCAFVSFVVDLSPPALPFDPWQACEIFGTVSVRTSLHSQEQQWRFRRKPLSRDWRSRTRPRTDWR